MEVQSLKKFLTGITVTDICHHPPHCLHNEFLGATNNLLSGREQMGSRRMTLEPTYLLDLRNRTDAWNKD